MTFLHLFRWIFASFVWLALTTRMLAADGGPLGTAEPTTYSGPITISHGGTYRGNWKSTSDSVPAVYITTTDPVVIEYSHLSGTGHLISAPTLILNLTVRNTSFHGHAPNTSTNFRGDGIRASGYKNLVVENNYFENTGIAVDTDEYSGDGTAQNTLTIRYNQVRNLNGLSAKGARHIVQFVALQNYRQPNGNPKNAEIAWNEVINLPGISFSEDLINFFKAGGRVDGWFKVHDNYLQGSYPANPATDSASGSSMIVDGPDHNRAAYIEAYNNFAINTTNAGMNIAAGSNIWYHHNRIISTGKLPDGTWMAGSFSGVGIFDFYAGDSEYTGTMHDIVVENNVVGWAKQNYNNPYKNRNDNAANLNGAYKASNVSLPDAPITQAMQDQEHQTFLQRVQDSAILLGPRAPASTDAAPTITPIPGSTINQDASTGPIPFTVGDAETAADSLTLTGSSPNATLVPAANIVFGGSGSSRTVTVTPAGGQSGVADVIITVSDGVRTASVTFTLTVNGPSPTPASAPPVIVPGSNAANAQIGVPFAYQIAASNSPTSFDASGLPGGLAVDVAAGIISGTPAQAGVFMLNLSAANASGIGTAILTLTIAPVATPEPMLPVVTLTASIPRVVAGTDASGEFVLTRAANDLSTPLLVDYMVKGSARNGIDYVRLKGFKKLKAGKASVKLRVIPIGDGSGPGVKRVVSLALSPSEGYSLGNSTKAKVKIIGL